MNEPEAQRSFLRKILEFLISYGIILGILFLVASAGLHSKIELLAIVLAEIGAVLLALALLHLAHDTFLREEYNREIKAAIDHAIGVELAAELKDIFDCSGLGIDRIHRHLGGHGIADRLREAKKIRVLKTWFPDDHRIKSGWEAAIRNQAKVALMLSDPDSSVLEARSVSVAVNPRAPSEAEKRRGKEAVIAAARRLDHVSEAARNDDVKFALFEGWPSSPIIWYDDVVLLGFYFNSKTSPHWPWIEIRKDSPLAKTLEEQWDLFWKGATERCENRGELQDLIRRKRAAWRLPEIEGEAASPDAG